MPLKSGRGKQTGSEKQREGSRLDIGVRSGKILVKSRKKEQDLYKGQAIIVEYFIIIN